MLPLIWPYTVWSWSRLFPRQSLPRPCISVRWPFIQNKSGEACPCIWQLFLSIHVPAIFNIFFQQYIQWCMCCPGNVDVLHWNRKSFFFRHVELNSRFIVMTINEISCNRPEVIFQLPRHPASSLLEVRLESVIHLICTENFLVLLLVPDNPGLRWVFSDAVLSQRFWLFYLRLGIWSFHFFAALTLPLHWPFGRGVLTRPSPPNSSKCLRP